jgi:hypothetical protein
MAENTEKKPGPTSLVAILGTVILGLVATRGGGKVEGISPPRSAEPAPTSEGGEGSGGSTLAPLEIAMLGDALPAQPEKTDDLSRLAEAWKTKFGKTGTKPDPVPLPRVSCLIATVPDPVRASISYQFDEALDSIERAAVVQHFVLERWRFPWSLKVEDSGTSRRMNVLGNGSQVATEKKPGPAAVPHPADGEPGVLVFRKIKSDPKEPTDLLVVFLVTEAPTYGVDRPALVRSLRLVAAIDSRLGARADGNNLWVRILGPSYSGSMPSMRDGLIEWRKADPRSPAYSVEVISGNASAFDRDSFVAALTPGFFTNCEFRATIHRSVTVQEAVLQYLGKTIDAPDVAILTELNTGFGVAFSLETGKKAGEKANSDVETEKKAGEKANSDVETGKKAGEKANSDKATTTFRVRSSLRFPLHIGEVRRVYESQGIFRDNASEAFHSQVEVRQQAEQAVKPRDILPDQTPGEAAMAENRVLVQSLKYLEDSGFRTIGIVATDTHDAIFLARLINRYCPDASVFIVGADLMLLDPEAITDMRGVLVGTTYPLFALNHEWTKSEKSSRGEVFPSQHAQGVYNAAAILLHRAWNPDKELAPIPPNLLLEYVAPPALRPDPPALRPESYELRLLPWGDGSGVPVAHKNSVFVGTDNNGKLHIRIFDPMGKCIEEADEEQLMTQERNETKKKELAADIEALKQQLPRLLPPHEMIYAERVQVIEKATSIVGQTRPEGSLFYLMPPVWISKVGERALYPVDCVMSKPVKDDGLKYLSLNTARDPQPAFRRRLEIDRVVGWLLALGLVVLGIAVYQARRPHPSSMDHRDSSHHTPDPGQDWQFATVNVALMVLLAFMARPLSVATMDRHRWIQLLAFVLVSATFILNGVFAFSRAAPDRWSSWSSRWFEVASIVVAALMFWAPLGLWDPQSQLQAVRATALTSGLSPLIPLGFLVAAVGAWCWGSNRLARINRELALPAPEPDPNPRRAGESGANHAASDLTAAAKRHREKFDRLFQPPVGGTRPGAWRPSWRASGPVVIVLWGAIVFDLLVLRPASRSDEGPFFDLVVLATMAGVLLWIGLEGVRVAAAWNELRKVLAGLDKLLGPALSRIPNRTSSWYLDPIEMRSDSRTLILRQVGYARSVIEENRAAEIGTGWHPAKPADRGPIHGDLSDLKDCLAEGISHPEGTGRELQVIRKIAGHLAPRWEAQSASERPREDDPGTSSGMSTRLAWALEDILALEAARWVGGALARVWTLIGSLVVAALALLLAMSSYPFPEQPRAMTMMCLVIFALAVLIVRVVVGVSRDAALSLLAGNDPGRITWNASFLGNIATYVVPLVGVLAAVSFSVTDLFRSVLGPILRLFP